MKILKKNVKLIIGIAIGAILISGVSVYAYSYFARDIGYTKQGTQTEISVEDALNDLYRKISSEMIAPVLLWTNTSPSSFTAQTINIDLSSYNRILIAWKYTSDATYVTDYYMNYVDNTRKINMIMAYPSSIEIVSRYVTATQTGIEFETGRNHTNLSGTTTNNNAKMIPIKIYGLPDEVLE